MARADAALMSSSIALLALLSHPPRLEKRLQIKKNTRLLVLDGPPHNLIDLAKIRVIACFIVIKGRRPA
jgi:hypothetical protein